MPLNPAQFRFLRSRVRTGTPVQTRNQQPLPTPAQSQGSRRNRTWEEGEVSVEEGFRSTIGPDSYPLPMIQHEEADVAIADLDPALLPNGVPVLILNLAGGTAADRLRISWEFTVAAQADALAVSPLFNGTPLINRLFNRPYIEMIDLYNKFDTRAGIQVNLVLRAGAVLVPPLGRVRVNVIVDGYRGTYVG